MASLDLPAGYRVKRTSTGYAAHSPYGLIRDDCDCEAEAIFAAQDHADSLALEEADELAAIADLEADLIREAA
ncbi:hypothetical protein [Methylobacterium brachiatum]|uniref:Uncharacterized protein n=1 Tax=Methylobacterium brachiatum TaxID=269660 RepID=A0AAJ1TLQ9_9HYPH|nr:hypothetical protein [Methylobacterium brachiatum]MCB4802680.1 hypothetical protein [Methylobacterium brachiatum]MDQ0543307.1 hypothetical protein [Methylobacterium brachiatum]